MKKLIQRFKELFYTDKQKTKKRFMEIVEKSNRPYSIDPEKLGMPSDLKEFTDSIQKSLEAETELELDRLPISRLSPKAKLQIRDIILEDINQKLDRLTYEG